MSTAMLTPSEFLDPPSAKKQPQQSTGRPGTTPDATKLDLVDLWHNDEKISEVSRAFRPNNSTALTPVYATDEYELAEAYDGQQQGRVIPSSRYKELCTRRALVLCEAHRADAARFAMPEPEELHVDVSEESSFEDSSTEADDEEGVTHEDSGFSVSDFSPDSGSKNMLGIPLERPPSLTQRTLDCGAAVSLSLLASVALERRPLLKEVLKNIQNWLAHCVPCSLSPNAGYTTVLSAGTVRRVLCFLLDAWKQGHPVAVKLAIQLAIARGELPLLVEVAWGLMAYDEAPGEGNGNDDPLASSTASRRRRSKAQHGHAVMSELEAARNFLFSTYCPSRRLALPTYLRAERRVAVGPGSVQGLAVAGGKASVLIASSGPGNRNASLLQMENSGRADKKIQPPFPVDADLIPSIASADDRSTIAVAASSIATPDATNPDQVTLGVNIYDTTAGVWKYFAARFTHPHHAKEKVICKVVSIGDAKTSEVKRIAVISTSGVPVDERPITPASAPLAPSQRRLLGDLHTHPEWEAAVAHVRAGTLPIERAVDGLVESVFRGAGDGIGMPELAPQLPEEIATLLQAVVRQHERNGEEGLAGVTPRAMVHWFTIPACEVPAKPEEEVPQPESPPVSTPTTPVAQQDPILQLGDQKPDRSVQLRIPQAPSGRNRHHQSALSLTRNSLPEFSHPLPKLSKTQPCTLEAWVRGAVDSPATILCWGTPEYRVHLSIDRQKRHTLYFVGSTTKHQHRGVSASVPGADSHHWVHLCVTHDGAHGWSLYRNGNLIGEPHMKDAHDKPAEPEDMAHVPPPGMRGIRVPRTSSIPDMRQSDRVMHGSVGNAFVGCVAEARVWAECRTADQVRAYLHTSLPPHECTPESSLLAYWPMDQSVGVQAYDHSSHRRHLLLQDGATWEHVPDMPVFRNPTCTPEGWPVYMPSLRGLSVFTADKELMLSVPKLSGGTSGSRVISTYDANTGHLLREKLVPLGVPVVCQGVAEGTEGGSTLPLDGPLALDAASGDIWALSQPTGLLVAGYGGSSEAILDDAIPSVDASGDHWSKVAGKGILNVLASLAQRHTSSAPAVLSALYLSPVVSCLKRLCRLLALGRETKDVELCKGAAGLLNACFSQNGWSPHAIRRNQSMLEELYDHACAVVDDDSWTTPTLTKAVEELLQSGVSAGVFFPSTTSKVSQFQKLLQEGWGTTSKRLSRSERTVLNVLVGALAGASAHYLLRGASVSVTLKQLLAAVRQPDAPPLLPLAVALQRCVVGLATTGDAAAVTRLAEYMTELFKISAEETPESPTATSTLVPLLLGSLPLLHKRLSNHCDLKALLYSLKGSLINLARKHPIDHTAVTCSEAASTIWHEIRLTGSSGPGSCDAYEFGSATSVALTIDTTGDYTVVYWDPNRPGSLLHSNEMGEMRQTRVTLETSRLVVAEVQKEHRRRRRTGSDRESSRPVSGILRAFGTEQAPRTGWLLDLIASVFTVTTQICGYTPPTQQNPPQSVSEWVTGSTLFQGGIVRILQNDVCNELIDGSEEGMKVWKSLIDGLGKRVVPGGVGTVTMLRAMLAALIRLTQPYPCPTDTATLLPLLTAVELHRDTICTRLRSADEGDDLVIDTFVKRCKFIVEKVKEMGLKNSNSHKPLTRRPSTAELTEVQRRLVVSDQNDDETAITAHELMRLCITPNLDLEELEEALLSQRDMAERRTEGLKTCASLVKETASLPLQPVPRGFVLLEVLRVAVACVMACGPHPLAGCQGSGPDASDSIQEVFFDLLKTALEADNLIDASQVAQLRSLQMTLLNLDWTERDLLRLEAVGGLKKLHDSCSLPSDDNTSLHASNHHHLDPELWRGRSTIGRGLLSLKLSADALGAAVYSPPGAEPSTSGWVWDHHDVAAPSALASETEVLHTVKPWVLSPPRLDAPRDSTAGCEYFEVRLSSVPAVQSLIDRHPKNTIAVGVARAPPQEGGAPKQFVWWKSDGTFAAELGPDAPNVPESSGSLPGASSSSSRSSSVVVNYVAGQTIGCGILKGTNEVYFTRNGKLVGFHAAVPGGEWYPAVWLGSKACLQCRFSPPFKFAARHPFVKPLNEVEVLGLRVRSLAWKAMTSVALKTARFRVTNPRVIRPITSLISSGISTVLTNSNVKWGHARAALAVLVRVAAGKGILKPLVPDDTTKALFRLASDPEAPLVLRVQALGVLCPVVSQSSPDEWDSIIQSVVGSKRLSHRSVAEWHVGMTRAFLQIGVGDNTPVPRELPLECSIPGDGMVRLLEELMLPCLPFMQSGPSELAVASSCLLRALLGSSLWQNTVATAISNRLARFASAVQDGKRSMSSILDTPIGSGFLVALRVLGALPSTTECGMRVFVHSPGAAPTLATVTEWYPTLHSARVLADGAPREVVVSRLEPADGPVACSTPLPSPEIGDLLTATLNATKAAFALAKDALCDTEEAVKNTAEPLPYLKALAEHSCKELSDDESHPYIGLLTTLPDPADRLGITYVKGVSKVAPSAISNWVLVGCLRLLEAYAEHYPEQTREALLQNRELLADVSGWAFTPKEGWSPEVASAPSRAHLEALSIHHLHALGKVGWGTKKSVRRPPQTPKRTLKVEPRLEFQTYTERNTHSCDGCGHHPLQVDTADWSAGWYRCNTCPDFDLCGRCFRRAVVHSDLGHSFTDISQIHAVTSESPLTTSVQNGTPSHAPESPISPVSPSPGRFQGTRRFIGILLSSDQCENLQYLRYLSPDMASGGAEVAALFPQMAEAGAEAAEMVPNAEGRLATKGPDGLYRCGAVVRGDLLCKCGYCQMYTSNRCGKHRGCSCLGCQALDRRTPDCVVDMQGIRETVSNAPVVNLWLGLLDTSTALCAIASRAVITMLAAETDTLSARADLTTLHAKPSPLAEELPSLLDWKGKWDLAGEFVASLLDHAPTVSTRSTAAALAIVECVVRMGGTAALHTLMGRLLSLCCQVHELMPQTPSMWRVVSTASEPLVKVTSSPSVLSTAHMALLPGQVVAEVRQCGKWLHHQLGWSPVEWNGVVVMKRISGPKGPRLDAHKPPSRHWIFHSSFDTALAILRPLLLGPHGDESRAGRWPLATMLKGTPSAITTQKGVSILAALVAAAHMHSRRKRRDALALVADLAPIFLKQYVGTSPPLAVTEGVEALAPLLRHVLAAHRTAPLSTGAPVWHAALELLVRLRRGLVTAGAADLLDDLVQSVSARSAKDSIFGLLEAFEDFVSRVIDDKPRSLPAVLTVQRRPDVPRAWTESTSISKHHHDLVSRRSRRPRSSAADSRSGTTLSVFLPAPVPDIDPTLIHAYRWGRPGGVREVAHPVLGVKQWAAFAQLVSSLSKSNNNLFRLSPETVYRALQHHVNPDMQPNSGGSSLMEVAGGISTPLPDLSRSEVTACLTTLYNINSLLLIPIVYFLDLSPHGTKHSELATRFMATKGLLLTQCKDAVVGTALKQTEVDASGIKPCLTFNRYPDHSDEAKDTHIQQPTTLLPQLHSHLCDGSVQLSCSTPAFAVRFSGEDGIDIGGLYKDLLSSISQELMSPSSTLLIPCDDRFYLNPNCTSPDELALLGTIGRLMGSCLRTGDILGIDLHPLFWKKLVWEPCTQEDHYDHEFFRTLKIAEEAKTGGRELTEDEFADLMLFFAVPGEMDQQKRCLLHDLIPQGRQVPVTLANRHTYCKLAAEAKLREADLQIEEVRKGILEVVPNVVLALLSAQEIETRVCGKPEIDISELAKNARLGIGISEDEIRDLWAVLSNCSRLDKQRFLRFVTGRPRMPLHQPLQIRIERIASSHRKDSLPMAHTCFNQLDLPRFSSAAILRDQLLLAVRHCDTTDVH